MTKLLEIAIERIKGFSEEEQDNIAQIILEQLALRLRRTYFTILRELTYYFPFELHLPAFASTGSSSSYSFSVPISRLSLRRLHPEMP